MKFVTITAAAILVATGALAQDLGTSKSASGVDIISLDMDGKGGGTAVIADGLGDKYACEIMEKRTHAEIGGCKPVRLSARVGGYIEAQSKVLGLFERNDCSLTYDQLKSALASASVETREAVGEIMADMTTSGALIDEEARGRARLTTGSVCSK